MAGYLVAVTLCDGIEKRAGEHITGTVAVHGGHGIWRDRDQGVAVINQSPLRAERDSKSFGSLPKCLRGSVQYIRSGPAKGFLTVAKQ